MIEAHFQTQMGRLGERWKGTYSPTLVTLIWREVKELSEPWFTHTVEEFIGSSRQAPLMTEFREKIAAERERLWSKQKRETKEVDWNLVVACDHCFDMGVYVCQRWDGVGGLYAFRCHCSKGFADPRTGIPQFKADHAKEFHWVDIRRHVEHAAKAIGRAHGSAS